VEQKKERGSYIFVVCDLVLAAAAAATFSAAAAAAKYIF
jgi:hypothetical protein